MNTPRGLLLVVLPLLAPPLAAQTLDDFENGVNPQGWSGLTTWGGGPAWGLESYSAIFPGFGGFNAFAPSTLTAPYVGDWRGAQVSELTFDVYNDYGSTTGIVYLYGPAGHAEFYFGLPVGWSVLSLPIPTPGQPAVPNWSTYFTGNSTWEDLLHNVTGVQMQFFHYSGFGFSATVRVDNIELVHATGFHLYAADLNAAGMPSTLTALNGTQGGLVGFGASLATGAATVNCTGSQLASGLATPQVLGIVPTDDYGHAHLTAAPPAGLSGTTLYLQALDVATCTMSNVLTMTLP